MEKKTFSRRSFLKGSAAAGLVAGAPGTGLFVRSAEAAELTRRVTEPPDVKEDADAKELADKLWEASVQGAYDAFNSAAEAFVKSKETTLDTAAALGKAGLRLRSPEARGAAKMITAPPSVIKVRELQLKKKGWHSHARGCFLVLCVHWHVSW